MEIIKYETHGGEVIYCDHCKTLLRIEGTDVKDFDKPRMDVKAFVGDEETKNAMSTFTKYAECPICGNKIGVNNMQIDRLHNVLTQNMLLSLENVSYETIKQVDAYLWGNNIKHKVIERKKNILGGTLSNNPNDIVEGIINKKKSDGK